MFRIIVELPRDRDYCGWLALFDTGGRQVCGPFAVAGRANDSRAAAEGNPSRNPLLRYGDTPAGSYRVKQIGAPVHDLRNFGPNGVIVIEAASGDAALAEANGRYRLFIQGGEAAPGGALRATTGALRLSNDDLGVLIGHLSRADSVRCDVVSHEDVPNGPAVFIDADSREEDPPSLPGTVNPLRDLFSEVSRRDAIRGAAGTAGLTALSLSVSFVSLTASTPAHAYTQMAYNEEPTAEVPETPPSNATGNLPTGDHTTVSPGDERTTPSEPSPISGDNGQPITGAGVQQGNTSVQLNPGARSPEAQGMQATPNQGAAPANNAMQQLQNATSGNQTTGQTFDNGRGPTDATPVDNTPPPPTPSAAPVELIDSQQQQLSNDSQYQQDVAAQAQAQKDAADAAQKYQTLDSQRKSNPALMNDQSFVTQYYQASDANTKAASAAATANVKVEDRKRVVIGAPIYKTAPPKGSQ